MKLEIVKKAFIVWHSGMINENPWEGFRMDELPITYAESAGKAKQLCCELDDYEINGEPHRFTDIKVRRAKEFDVVLFEGHEFKRNQVLHIIESRKKHQVRSKFVNSFSDDTTFYIQNGFSGNSILFWAKGDAGYTTNIEKAQEYTKDEVLRRFVNGRDEDVIWESNHIMDNVKKHVDSQFLNVKYRG